NGGPGSAGKKPCSRRAPSNAAPTPHDLLGGGPRTNRPRLHRPEPVAGAAANSRVIAADGGGKPGAAFPGMARAPIYPGSVGRGVETTSQSAFRPSPERGTIGGQQRTG